jgi:hypothetical protein
LLVETAHSSNTPVVPPTPDAGTPNDPATVDRIPNDIYLRNGQAWKQLALNVRHDQKHVIQFPFHLVTEGRHWKPTLAVGAITAGLVALDPYDTPYFRRTTAFHGFDKVASGTNTAAAMVLVPVVFYAWSAHKQDTYGKQTVFLAAEAVVDVQILTFGMKMIDRRTRPIDVRSHGNYADTWFDAGVFGGKSFPSGHTITAFALADVFTERYPRHRWVPWVSYALASTVAFSRLPLQAHFPSDVFAAAVLGPVITHYLVLHHRDR